MNPISSNRNLEDYPPDILARIVRDFDPDAVSQVHSLLEEIRADRCIRCALFLANGSIDGLKEAVTLGNFDYRDLIMAGEYDRFNEQLRDFNKPFPPEE